MIDGTPTTPQATSAPRLGKECAGRPDVFVARRRTQAAGGASVARVGAILRRAARRAEPVSVTAALVAAVTAIVAAVVITWVLGTDPGTVVLPDSSQISGAFQDPTPVYRLPTAVIVAKRLTPDEVAALRAKDRLDAALSDNEYGADAAGKDLRR